MMLAEKCKRIEEEVMAVNETRQDNLVRSKKVSVETIQSLVAIGGGPSSCKDNSLGTGKRVEPEGDYCDE
jgi:hypothetical protein